MTIAKRITLLIGILLAALLGVGGIGVTQINKIAGEVHYESDQLLPAIQLSGKLARQYLMVRIAMLNMLNSTEPREIARFDNEIVNLHKEIDAVVDEYNRKYILDDNDRALLEKIKTLLKQYDEIINPGLALARRGLREEAVAQVVPGRVISDQIVEALTSHIDYTRDLAQEFANKSEKGGVRSEYTMMIVIALSTLIGLLFGVMTYRSVVGALTKMKGVVQEISSELDFTRRIDTRGNDEIARTTQAINELLETVQNSFSRLVEHATQVTAAASSLAQSAQHVAASSAEQSDAAASVAAAVEEMTSSINHVADRSGEANELATRSGEVARTGAAVINDSLQDIRHIGQVVNNASGTVEQLDNESSKVTSVVAVIKEVAEQTNLLALNAAIEAARAGEQGRGFAVVADEVRKLAERTALSTQEISATLEHMQVGARNAVNGMSTAVEQVTKGVEHTEEAERSIRQIATSSEQTVEMVNEISWAIREQSEASTNIAQQVERIAQMIEGNNAAAGTTAETATQLNALAAQMQEEISRYRV